jgi:Ni/Co efflux regulator RcnB
VSGVSQVHAIAIALAATSSANEGVHMKRIHTTALSQALIAMTGAAVAGPYQDNHRDQNHSRSDWNDHDRGGKDHRDQQRYDRHDNRPQQWHDNGHHYGHGPGPRYYRGQHLPPRYMGSSYYVHDYRHYRLHDPRPGYRWVRSDDGQFLLVAIATGLVVEALLSQ